MSTHKVQPKEFIKAYNKHDSMRELADYLGLTYGTVRTLSWKYRKQGLITTKKKTRIKDVAK